MSPYIYQPVRYLKYRNRLGGVQNNVNNLNQMNQMSQINQIPTNQMPYNPMQQQ